MLPPPHPSATIPLPPLPSVAVTLPPSPSIMYSIVEGGGIQNDTVAASAAADISKMITDN